jgi:hypothetical protein
MRHNISIVYVTLVGGSLHHSYLSSLRRKLVHFHAFLTALALGRVLKFSSTIMRVACNTELRYQRQTQR